MKPVSSEFADQYPQQEQATSQPQAPERRVDSEASASEITTQLEGYVKNQEGLRAFSPIVAQSFEGKFLGAIMVSQQILSRGGCRPYLTHSGGCSLCPPRGHACSKIMLNKAVGIPTPSVVMITKATTDDSCKGSQGGTCMSSADAREYHHISLWVALPPPAHTGGAALAWPPPLRPDSNTHAAAWWNRYMTADRAQTKAVSRLG